ncbi:hypothetical protein BJ508DRAFT_28418 [Ascobolus immersus RN42]|uniref:Uncharacterized protein n=1 Tax=Ascobolus immersus RN42 TaxID=1160509 RepID=A0A3N4HM81_ASCIM|nr:hypothetical protein BJ508DRAFT_28418 [Ascobolus immersus RN42]
MRVIYGHRLKNIPDPVRSPIVKLPITKLVLRWVTTREPLVLYVLPLHMGYTPVLLGGFPRCTKCEFLLILHATQHRCFFPSVPLDEFRMTPSKCPSIQGTFGELKIPQPERTCDVTRQDN